MRRTKTKTKIDANSDEVEEQIEHDDSKEERQSKDEKKFVKAFKESDINLVVRFWYDCDTHVIINESQDSLFFENNTANEITARELDFQVLRKFSDQKTDADL